MRDIELAKYFLEEEKLTLVIVKEGQICFKSRDKGIKPLYMAVNNLGMELLGASVADKIIGRAAALLCTFVSIKELYTKTISQGALTILLKEDILFSYDELTPFVKNREQTGMCPVEKLAQYIENPIYLLKEIEKFLAKIA